MFALMKLTKTELTDLHDVIEDGTQNKPNIWNNTTDKRRLVEKITLTTYNQLQDARKYRYMYLKLKENFEETIERLNEAHQRGRKLREEKDEEIKILKEEIEKLKEVDDEMMFKFGLLPHLKEECDELHEENKFLKEKMKEKEEIFAKVVNTHIEEKKNLEDFIVESLNLIKN